MTAITEWYMWEQLAPEGYIRGVKFVSVVGMPADFWFPPEPDWWEKAKNFLSLWLPKLASFLLTKPEVLVALINWVESLLFQQ